MIAWLIVKLMLWASLLAGCFAVNPAATVMGVLFFVLRSVARRATLTLSDQRKDTE